MQEQATVPVTLGIKYITYEQAVSIIDTKAPRGLFYTQEGIMFTGIKNVDGNPDVLAFVKEPDCIKWLEGR